MTERRELAMKAIFLQAMRANKVIDRSSVVASEYVLARNGRRADLAILADNFIGVEIKSDFDTLYRLEEQMAVYERCFEKTVVVLAAKHLDACLAIAPSHVEVWIIDGAGTPRMMRAGANPPAFSDEFRLNLLPITTLRKLGNLPKGTKRADLIRACSQLPSDRISEAVKDNFRNSFEKTSSEFWEGISQRKISQTDVLNLSRYADDRLRSTNAVTERVKFWEEWNRNASSFFEMTA